jgi:hypothetical protein
MGTTGEVFEARCRTRTQTCGTSSLPQTTSSPQSIVRKLSLSTHTRHRHCWVVSFVSFFIVLFILFVANHLGHTRHKPQLFPQTLVSKRPDFPSFSYLACDYRSIVRILRSQRPNCSVHRDQSPLFFLNCLLSSTSSLRTTLVPSWPGQQ